MTTISRFPLQWPTGWKRIHISDRKEATFTSYKRRLSVWDGVQRVRAELARLGVLEADTVISTNVELRLDGMPRSDRAAPADPGVCVYWQEQGGNRPMRCMAVDRYDTVADNLAAVAATLDAMRAIERHGGAAILDRAFTGFTALPAPIVAGSMKRPWREVLQYGNSPLYADAIRQHFRILASTAHPDKGGTDAAMAELTAARDEALKEIQA